MSIYSVFSYNRVVNPGISDPSDFGFPSLQKCPSSDNLSTSFSIDNTFTFLKHPSRTQRGADSNASSFYFHVPTSHLHDQHRESTLSVASQAPPVSLLKRSFALHSNFNGSTGSRLMPGQHKCLNTSTESVTIELSAMQLGRLGLSEKMFDMTDQALPPSSTLSTHSSYNFSLSPMPDQLMLDSILDGDCHKPPLWLSPFLLFFSLLFSFLFIAWESLSHYVTQGVTVSHQTVTSQSWSPVTSHITRSHGSMGK